MVTGLGMNCVGTLVAQEGQFGDVIQPESGGLSPSDAGNGSLRAGGARSRPSSRVGPEEGVSKYSLNKAKVKVVQLCLTLYNPMDYTIHGILQAKILKWVAFPFSRGSSQLRDQTQVSHSAGGFFTS